MCVIVSVKLYFVKLCEESEFLFQILGTVIGEHMDWCPVLESNFRLVPIMHCPHLYVVSLLSHESGTRAVVSLLTLLSAVA